MLEKNISKYLMVIACSIMIFFSGCYSKNSNTSLSQELINRINSTDAIESNTALLLLPHIALTGEDINHITQLYYKEKDLIKKLFLAYVLSVRTQEQKYVNAFIELYPLGKAQKPIWHIVQNETDYINVASPLQSQLATYAMYDSKALRKLVSGYKFADGANAEMLSTQLIGIYKKHPIKILKELKNNNIPPSRIGIN
ncbi:MAG: hypothetical protein GY699_10600 [Desulfobacteraceae bacterium]|nr:hypothetical protein [Desulfobacteraceae bacterium]